MVDKKINQEEEKCPVGNEAFRLAKDKHEKILEFTDMFNELLHGKNPLTGEGGLIMFMYTMKSHVIECNESAKKTKHILWAVFIAVMTGILLKIPWNNFMNWLSNL